MFWLQVVTALLLSTIAIIMLIMEFTKKDK